MVKLKDYLSEPDNRHKQERNPSVRCNAIYKKKENLNCLLKPNEAIQLARNLLQKAQLILEEGITDAAVHIWNQGDDSETIYCGLNIARKGARRKSNAAPK